MSFRGEVVAIYIGREKQQPMQSVDTVQATAGVGLAGDRYGDQRWRGATRPEQEVTLIESEAIEAAAHDYELELNAAQTRRNLVTRGVPLNHLVNQDFSVGSVRLRGLELCEPCGHLEKQTFRGIKKALLHRGGLRAQILSGGEIRVGDPIEPAE